MEFELNEEIISLDELYSACKKALEICSELSPVARVIARPYTGKKAGEIRKIFLSTLLFCAILQTLQKNTHAVFSEGA